LERVEQIGLRELKNRLSHYVRRVRAGHPIQVTDRGEVVAELVPPASSSATGATARRRLTEMARRGLIRLGAPNDRRLYRRLPRLVPRGTVKRLLDDERGER
jgi:prevent-host-death family protein